MVFICASSGCSIGRNPGLAGAVHLVEPSAGARRSAGAPDLPPARPRCRGSGAANPERHRLATGGTEPLAWDEALLNKVFGLLVLAHYQTSPSDLQVFAGGPDRHPPAGAGRGIARRGAGGAGRAIFPGTGPRYLGGAAAPRGHLLPQSLLAHAGFTTAGIALYARVMRIAIHPSLHRLGLGSPAAREAGDTLSRRGRRLSGIRLSASPPTCCPFLKPRGLTALRNRSAAGCGQRQSCSLAAVQAAAHRLRRRSWHNGASVS